MNPQAGLTSEQPQGGNLREGAIPLVWTIQGYGLILLTALSFFPSFIHAKNHLFFLLLGIALFTAWKQGKTPWVRSPLDLPLVLYVSWVLFTVPFAT